MAARRKCIYSREYVLWVSKISRMKIFPHLSNDNRNHKSQIKTSHDMIDDVIFTRHTHHPTWPRATTTCYWCPCLIPPTLLLLSRSSLHRTSSTRISHSHNRYTHAKQNSKLKQTQNSLLPPCLIPPLLLLPLSSIHPQDFPTTDISRSIIYIKRQLNY